MVVGRRNNFASVTRCINDEQCRRPWTMRQIFYAWNTLCGIGNLNDGQLHVVALYSVILSFIDLLIYSFIHSFIHSFILVKFTMLTNILSFKSLGD